MQRILEGISALKTALEDSRRAFLVCDGSWPYLNIGPAVETAIAGIGSPVLKFSDFGSNPLYESVCKGVEEFNASGCDTIVAVGGGSSIDVAKCIKLFCRMTPGTLFLKQPFEDTGVKLIAIPTTAGTGSESTRYAVAYYNGEKQSITHQSIIPDYAVLEPSVLDSLPLYQKKCTMMDAFCQAIESWWSVNATPASRELSRKTIGLIMANWKAYIFGAEALSDRPGSLRSSLPSQAMGPSRSHCHGRHASRSDNAISTAMDASIAIIRAANLAGQAINITQTTAPHAFSYKLTSLFGLPHGHAVALCLPEIWEFMLAKDRLDCFTDIAHAMGAETPEDAIALFRSMMNRMELSPFDRIYPPKGRKIPANARLEDISCQDREDHLSEPERTDVLNILASSVNPIRLANNPVPISEPEALAIYSKVLSI